MIFSKNKKNKENKEIKEEYLTCDDDTLYKAISILKNSPDFLRNLTYHLFSSDAITIRIETTIRNKLDFILETMGMTVVQNEIELIKDSMRTEMKNKVKEIFDKHYLWADADGYRQELYKYIKEEYMHQMSINYDHFMEKKK